MVLTIGISGSMLTSGEAMMLGVSSPPNVVRFGDYEADMSLGRLRKRGVNLKLRPQSFEVLAILLEHPGEVVSREELRRRLWPGDVFVDFETNLNCAMARLREALTDSAEHPRFIETLPKRGYRFIASLSKQAGSRFRLIVLPFANLSGDPDQEYFSDAMTEEIITELANVAPDRLAVIARTTAMHYRGTRKNIAQVGRELTVEYVVEGSVRRAGDQIAVNVQLIQVSDQTHLFAKTYNAELHDVFHIQNEVAQAIAARLGIIWQASTRRLPKDLQAYNLYIQGRYHLAKGNPELMMKAKEYLEQAIARSPDFALAHDAIAEIYWYWGFFGFMPPRKACSVGIYHAIRALQIDNTLAETHALVAVYRKQLSYDWPEVRREMELALKLDPASPLVRTRYAMGGPLPLGRMEEAAAELETALESDPLSPFIRNWLVCVLWLGRHYDRAVEEARSLLEHEPADCAGHLAAGLCYWDAGLREESIGAHRRTVELSHGSPLMLGWLGFALARHGETAEARAIQERLHQMAREAYVPPSSFAWTYLGLGEINNAFTWMGRAIDEGDQMLIPIKTYPFLDPLRSDPRFPALLRKMNLQQ